MNEILSTQTKIDKLYSFWQNHFFTLGSISPSILGLEKATIYQTRGHWTAMLALIKVDEIAQNLKHFTWKKYSKMVQFSGNRHTVSVQMSKWLQNGPFL